jgi:hypothetical protein
MKKTILLTCLLSTISWSSPPDSTEAVTVAETVFLAMQEGNGEIIIANLSDAALLEVDEILANLLEYPDLTLAMLSFNWGVETVPLDYVEWSNDDLLSAIYSSPLSRSILLDSDNTRSGFQLSGSAATVTWILSGEEWSMTLAHENGSWKVCNLEEF